MTSDLDLAEKSRQARIILLKSIFKAGSGHPAGSLGAVDILVAFYFRILNHHPKEPNWPERDRFILSNGHICPAWYAVLALAGYFPLSKMDTLRKLNSNLQGHPERGRLPGVETTSGPLGSGLAQAVGMALAAKLDRRNFRIYCLTSDGEHDAGNHWEAVMTAVKYHLANLTLVVDRNGIQLSGKTEEIMPLEPLVKKYEAFNWHTLEIDGHNYEEIIQAVEKAKSYSDAPTVIIAKTVPGKGVSFMEGNWHWHGKVPNENEMKQALEELNREV